MAWEFVKSGIDGNCELFGVNIFDYEWETTGKRIKVKDPIYNQFHTFEIWRVEIGGQTKYFAAGEFSNCVKCTPIIGHFNKLILRTGS